MIFNFLSHQLKSSLSDIAEDTLPHDAARNSRAIAAIQETGAHWRKIRDAQFHLDAFEEVIDVWPHNYDECLNSPISFEKAFWEYVGASPEVFEPDTYLDVPPDSEAIEALRLRMRDVG